MTSQEGTRERGPRKITKKRKDPKRVSLDIPERLQYGDDVQDDVTAPKSAESRNMNQSIFSLIARVGSHADLPAHYEEQSSESEGEGRSKDQPAPFKLHTEDGRTLKPSGEHRRKLSTQNLLKSLPHLGKKRNRDQRLGPAESRISSSQMLQPTNSTDGSITVRKSERLLRGRLPSSHGAAEGELQEHTRQEERQSPEVVSKAAGYSVLSQRLMQVFEFESLEEIIAEYPCWLVQSILLEGYMYVTQKHMCFFAYLSKQAKDVGKTGFISKRGRSKFNRYWFVLKGDVLSYYNDAINVYFPRNRLNLRHAISASVVDPKDKNKEATSFILETDRKTYTFKADSAASALEWVRAIQKSIFKTHNDGHSVKISLPLKNVLDVEENPLLDFADTIKVRVIDNDETYAIDEYYFSFFQSGVDALRVLRIMVGSEDDKNNSPSPASSEKEATAEQGRKSIQREQIFGNHPTTPVIEESVKATLLPLPPANIRTASPRTNSPRITSPRFSMDSHRSSHEVSRKSLDVPRSFRKPSTDRGRRSFSGRRSASQSKSRATRPGSPHPNKHQESSESASNSLDPGTESSAAIQSLDDTNASASQILQRSDVFQGPTIQHASISASDPSLIRDSQDTARSLNSSPNVHLHARRDIQPLKSQPVKEMQAPDVDDDADQQMLRNRTSGSSSALHDIMRAGAYPLQKASGLAGFLKIRSKKMSNLLATESMGYYEKVSGMWAGGRKHYRTEDGLAPDDQIRGIEDEEDAAVDAERFREHFALPQTEELQATFFGSLQRVIPLYGKLYISDRHICFRSIVPTPRTKLILPLKDIENVDKEQGFRLHYYGLVIVVRGHEELFFEFGKVEMRDDCAITLLRRLESLQYLDNSNSEGEEDSLDEEEAKAEHAMLQEARKSISLSIPLSSTQISQESESTRIPLIFDDPHASIIDFKPAKSLRITCLTIGSRGDVQPYIALCKGLQAEGHHVRIATHAEFEPWIRKHKIDFAPVDGDPAELMRVCVENGMFTVSFFREASDKFRGWIDDLLRSSWKACEGSDVLIESPSAMGGIHVAEAMGIPYFRAFGMPWTKTRAYPHAFAVPHNKMGGHYNMGTYVAFDHVFWAAISGQINSWRKDTLKLPPTGLGKMQPNMRPFLYFFSPSVVPPPLDWPDWIRVTGYWFLDEASTWEPPEDLRKFIKKARDDRKKLVYVGFGSIVVDDPAALTNTVIESVLKADVRCILSKGWSDRLGKKADDEVELPPQILQIQSAPHDWLFNQIDAAVHHGGAGTTGASLRAGIPTVIKPFFGDQWFFGSRVEDLGVGLCMRKINTSLLARSMWEATHSQRMIVRAKVLGERIRKENGIQKAIETIYRELERAKSLAKSYERGRVAAADGAADEDLEDEWTWVNRDGDAEASTDMTEWQPLTNMSQAPQQQQNPGGSAIAMGTVMLRGAQTVSDSKGV